MSEAYTITDDAILAAWGNPDDLCGTDLSEAVEQIREAVEMAGDAPATVWLIEDHLEARVLSVDVASVRDRLGGWDAVWRAVLKDEGFEEEIANRRWDLREGDEAILFVRRRPRDEVPGHEWRLESWEWSVPLRSPADLRVRKKAAEILFGEGTGNTKGE